MKLHVPAEAMMDHTVHILSGPIEPSHLLQHLTHAGHHLTHFFGTLDSTLLLPIYLPIYL